MNVLYYYNSMSFLVRVVIHSFNMCQELVVFIGLSVCDCVGVNQASFEWYFLSARVRAVRILAA